MTRLTQDSMRLARRVWMLPPLRRLHSEIVTHRTNSRWRGADAKILAIRHPRYHALNKPLLRWLEQNFPETRRHFDVRLLPVLGLPFGIKAPAFDFSRYRLGLLWLQDPIPAWSEKDNCEAIGIEQRMLKAGLPMMNAPTQLPGAEKAATARLAIGLGVRTPKTVALRASKDLQEFQRVVQGPVLVRSDWAHGGTIHWLEADEQLSWSVVSTLVRPIATEFINTADADGIFWKYRYLAAGEYGVSVHMIASTRWEVRGSHKLTDAAALQRERQFIGQANPHHETMQRIRLALGLDTVALDYAFDTTGQLVLWEANPCPGLRFGSRMPALLYREEALHRSFAALTGAYLDRAGLAVPEVIQELRAYGPESKQMMEKLRRD